MIQIPHHELPKKTQDYLNKKQQEVNNANDYPEQVKVAQGKWDSKDDDHFKVVREVLKKMTLMGRCHYCEDSVADEVEHIKPKTLYPGQVFQWSNYLFACGPCNGSHKGDRFAVINDRDELVEVTRPRDEAVAPPQAGEPAFIDPRTENPMDFLWLDLTGSFFFEPWDEDNDKARLKAQFTREILGLNSRDVLVKARETAFKNYLGRLKGYVEEKRDGASPSQLQEMCRELWAEPHASVWREMMRSGPRIPKLAKLLDAAPELMQEP